MPKGIISQTQEAKKHAHKFDATIGIAKEKGKPMYLNSIYELFNHLTPEQIFPYASPYGDKREWSFKAAQPPYVKS